MIVNFVVDFFQNSFIVFEFRNYLSKVFNAFWDCHLNFLIIIDYNFQIFNTTKIKNIFHVFFVLFKIYNKYWTIVISLTIFINVLIILYFSFKNDDDMISFIDSNSLIINLNLMLKSLFEDIVFKNWFDLMWKEICNVLKFNEKSLCLRIKIKD